MRLLLLVSIGCGRPSSEKTVAGPEDTGESVLRCNGHAALCDRPLDEVAFAASHNSMSSADRGWMAPNHRTAVPTQLAGGIRALNLDIHDLFGVPTLCHGYCGLGSQPLVEGLEEVHVFMTDHPHEVVLITLENYISAERTVEAFAESGLADLAMAHSAGTSWPTLGEMVESGQRLVVFTGDGGGTPDWYHAMWDWWRDNPYDAQTIADFSCSHYRGAEDAELYAINHFLTAPIALEELAEVANQVDVLEDHTDRCQADTGRFPNLVMVDFYSIGDLLPAINGLNGVDPAR